MSTLPARGRPTKKARIFDLMDRGIEDWQIAERLGVHQGTVNNWRVVWRKQKTSENRDA